MYLGLDVWDKRCGIAIFLEGIILPKEIVPRTKIVQVLKKYFTDYDIKVVVYGLPYDMYWKDKLQLEKTLKFVEKLKSIFPGIEFFWVDERFSTFEAENVLVSLWKKENIWKKDAISASIILESYLKSKWIY